MVRRTNVHGDGTWSAPGGHIDKGESLEQCAQREVFEETGVTIKNIRFLAVTNDIFEAEGKHYRDLDVCRLRKWYCLRCGTAGAE
ncbi:MAG TPA: NUDIX domain-containing protein [Gammaproteobacteria bacterium]